MSVVLDPDLIEQVNQEANLLKAQDVVAYLAETVGDRVTAYISGADDVDAVEGWIAQKAKPSDEEDFRLRTGYRVCRMLVEVYGPDTTKAWLFGSNTRLDDEAPAYVVRYASSIDDVQPVVPAARAFAGAAA